MSFLNIAGKVVGAGIGGYGANYAAQRFGGVEATGIAGIGAGIAGAAAGWFAADALMTAMGSSGAPAIAAGIPAPVTPAAPMPEVV